MPLHPCFRFDDAMLHAAVSQLRLQAECHAFQLILLDQVCLRSLRHPNVVFVYGVVVPPLEHNDGENGDQQHAVQSAPQGAGMVRAPATCSLLRMTAVVRLCSVPQRCPDPGMPSREWPCIIHQSADADGGASPQAGVDRCCCDSAGAAAGHRHGVHVGRLAAQRPVAAPGDGAGWPHPPLYCPGRCQGASDRLA